MSHQVAIFIDGGYLIKLLEDEFDSLKRRGRRNLKLDYRKLVTSLLRAYHKECDLFRVYYYDCLPYQKDEQADEENDKFGSRQTLFGALSRIPNFKIVYGRLSRDIDKKTKEPVFTQKEVDVKLALDLAMLSVKKVIQHAIVVSADSDFVPAIHIAQSEGVQVAVSCFSRKRNSNKELKNSADYFIRLSEDLIRDCLYN